MNKDTKLLLGAVVFGFLSLFLNGISPDAGNLAAVLGGLFAFVAIAFLTMSVVTWLRREDEEDGDEYDEVMELYEDK